MFRKLVQHLRFLTIHQWQKIDEEYRRDTGFNGQIAIVLVVIALSLLLQRYFGSGKFFAESTVLAHELSQLPYPTLYPRLYWALFKTISYFLLPALTIKLILRGKIRDYGFRFSNEGRIALLYVAMIVVTILLAYVASFLPEFLRTYPKYKQAGDSSVQFWLWEIAYGYQFMLLEFFFRGFILFALARHFGAMSIFVMIVPYSMIHYSKPVLETLGSMAGGVALGTLALRTRSIFGGVLAHCMVGWSMDIFALIRKGQF